MDVLAYCYALDVQYATRHQGRVHLALGEFFDVATGVVTDLPLARAVADGPLVHKRYAEGCCRTLFIV